MVNIGVISAKNIKNKKGVSMNDYDVMIKFKSKGSKADYIDDNDIIYKFIRENFWNISNYSYDFKIVKEEKDNA